MKKLTLFLLAFIAMSALAKKPGFKKYTGSYNLSVNGMTYSVVVARDRCTTILSGREKDPVAGKVKFWRGRQEIRLLYPQYTFKGFANSLDLITGEFMDVTKSPDYVDATLERTTNSVFHIKFLKSKKRSVKGDVFYNYGKEIKPRSYYLAFYYRTDDKTYYLRKTKKLPKLGFFNQKFPQYQQVDVYVVSADGIADLPAEYTSPLSVDGKKIMAYNYCEPGYKQPRDVYKNK
ncbi:hypothetical protein IKS73_01630 [bacterium]|nr:hypothetical protein [bacterium]